MPDSHVVIVSVIFTREHGLLLNRRQNSESAFKENILRVLKKHSYIKVLRELKYMFDNSHCNSTYQNCLFKPQIPLYDIFIL